VTIKVVARGALLQQLPQLLSGVLVLSCCACCSAVMDDCASCSNAQQQKSRVVCMVLIALLSCPKLLLRQVGWHSAAHRCSTSRQAAAAEQSVQPTCYATDPHDRIQQQIS
jgi:hypothetical protein